MHKRDGFKVSHFINYLAGKHLTGPVAVETYPEIEDIIKCAENTFMPLYKQLESWVIENWVTFKRLTQKNSAGYASKIK